LLSSGCRWFGRDVDVKGADFWFLFVATFDFLEMVFVGCGDDCLGNPSCSKENLGVPA